MLAGMFAGKCWRGCFVLEDVGGDVEQILDQYCILSFYPELRNCCKRELSFERERDPISIVLQTF
jgi:hypothetical protein